METGYWQSCYRGEGTEGIECGYKRTIREICVMMEMFCIVTSWMSVSWL